MQFYKALSGLDNIEWLNELSMVETGVNVRNGGIRCHREPANISTERDQFFINRVIYTIKVIIQCRTVRLYDVKFRQMTFDF